MNLFKSYIKYIVILAAFVVCLSLGANDAKAAYYEYHNYTEDCDWGNANNWEGQNMPTDPGDDVGVYGDVCYSSIGDVYLNNVTFYSGGWDVYYNYMYLYVSGTASFYNSSYMNYGYIGGNVVFNNSSYHNDGTIYGNATFNNSSYSNYGDIDGNATFNDSSYSDCTYYYSGSTQITLNGASYFTACGPEVYSVLQINSTWFNGVSPNDQDLTFGADKYWGIYAYNSILDADGDPMTSFTFTNNSYNGGQIGVTSYFYDSSANNNYISGSANFYNDSVNNSTVNLPANFFNNSTNSGSVGDNTVFNNSSRNNSTVNGSATFNGSSYIGGGTITGNAYLKTDYYNGSLQNGSSFTINSGKNWYGDVGGTIYSNNNTAVTLVNFAASSINYGTLRVPTIFNSARNQGTVVASTTFLGVSLNTGTVTGAAKFYDTASSSGPVTSATFYGNSTEYISGTITNKPPVRYYTSPVSPTRNFVTAAGAPWNIVADGVVVNMSGATCNASTTRTVVNGGSFTYGGANCAAGPAGISITSPLNNDTVTTWSPQVNWNQGVGGYNYSSCQYSFGDSSHWATSSADWATGTPEVGTWQGASCSGIGAEISAPQNRGTQYFVIRAFYSGVATTSIRTITYSPARSLYFYNVGSNDLWATVANWFTDLLHTILSNERPTSVDTASITGTTTPVVDLDTWIEPTSINSGTIGVSFTSNSGASTTITINGKATYNGSAVNSGTVNGSAVFNNTAHNSGTIKSNATFNASSVNAGSVLGSAVFNGDAAENTGTVSGIKTRYYTATTTTTRNLVGWTVVADGVRVNVASSTHDATTIFRTLNGGTFVGGPTTVYWYSTGDQNWTTIGNWYSVGTSTALGRVASSTEMVVILGTTTPVIDLATSTWIQPSGIDATLTGIIITASTSQTINTGITGSTTLSGAVTNAGTISGDTTISGTSNNAGVIVGNVDLYDTAQNAGIISGDATFNDITRNTAGGSIAGDATFNDNSYNNTNAGAIGGTARFNDSAYNSGTITYNAVFGNNSTENIGTVGGLKTRYFTASTTVNRNFVTGGPWILVADGVEVTIASTSVFNATTTFSEVNGGNFVGDGVPGSYTTCANSIIQPGTYTLQGNVTGTCDIRSNGVTINGNGHTIGSAPQALPNNGVSNGWFDMTGNKLLLHMESNLTDSSGSGFNGSLGAGSLTYPSGVVGTSANTGSSVQLNISSNSAFDSNTMTAGGWFKFNGDHSTTQFLFGKQDCSSNNGYEIIMSREYANTIAYGVAYSGQWQIVESNTPITDTNWHHIMITASTSQLVAYIDGQSVGSRSLSGFAHNAGAQLHIGYCRTGYMVPFQGSIDEFGYWNRVLSPSEISALYSGQTNGGYITGNGYDFDLSNITVGASVTSAGATINVANSTISTINVNGANAVGDAQAGGTVNLTNSTATTVTANGGNSTDYGYGGAAGHINLTNSTVTTQSATAGSNGPNKGTGQQNTGGSSGSSNPISGCMDPNATNYNANATVSGSCIYSSPIVRGCTDPSASNYNSSATVSDGSCTYPTPVIPVPAGNNNNGGSSGGDLSPINGVSIPVASFGGSLYLKPIPGFSFGVDGAGNTVLGNPLAGLKPLGNLDLKGINFSFTLPISEFIFAPLPKSITQALSKAPKLSDAIASVGISRTQDLVKLQDRSIKLPISSETPGSFTVSRGTTTLDLYIANDQRYSLVELVHVIAGDILSIDLVPLGTEKVLAAFNNKVISFLPSSKTKVNAIVTAPAIPGRYILATDAAPLPLVIDVAAPAPPPQQAKPQTLKWWQKVLKWFGKSP